MKFRKWAALFSFATAALVACTPRPRNGGGSGAGSPESNSLLVFSLANGIPETASGGLLQQSPLRTFTALARSVQRFSEDAELPGAFVTLGAANLGWAQSEELAALFEKAKKKGKPVVCHAHVLSNSTSAFALRACSRVWLSPGGEAETVGIAAQVIYMRGLFDKLKVGVDFLHVGKFKSGVEPFTREGPSEPARESLIETLAAIRAAWLDQVTAAGKPATLRTDLEQGPWSATEAKAKGLVDEVGFASDALAEAKRLSRADKVSAGYGGEQGGSNGLSEILRTIAGGKSGSSQPHVAVLPAEGAIAMESGTAFDSGGITAKALTKTLLRLKKDDTIKAVVLRIDSPGGSALASDLLWHELSELKKVKPLVVSVGGMAASGGYYMACASQKIVAEPTSIVGSIGVFGGKIVLSETLEQFGLHAETFPASPERGAAARAALQSPFSAWDDATRERVQSEMQAIYDLFIARVAAGRNLPTARVEEIAQGRIWSGQQGLERGLVDQLGGVNEAIRLAQKLASLAPDSPVTVEGSQDGLLEMLLANDDANEAELRQKLEALQARSLVLRELPAPVRRYVGALGPLAQGERIVAALPFGMTLE